MIKRERPHLVTEAAVSPVEEHKRRQHRYLLTMIVRMVLLVVAVLVARANVPLGIVVGVLSAVLPGFAVVMANDGPPKSSKYYRRVVPTGAGERALPAPDGGAMGPRVITADAVIIDENGATLRAKE